MTPCLWKAQCVSRRADVCRECAATHQAHCMIDRAAGDPRRGPSVTLLQSRSAAHGEEHSRSAKDPRHQLQGGNTSKIAGPLQ